MATPAAQIPAKIDPATTTAPASLLPAPSANPAIAAIAIIPVAVQRSEGRPVGAPASTKACLLAIPGTVSVCARIEIDRSVLQVHQHATHPRIETLLAFP